MDKSRIYAAHVITRETCGNCFLYSLLRSSRSCSLMVLFRSSCARGAAEQHAGLNVHVWPSTLTRKSPSAYTFWTRPILPKACGMWNKRWPMSAKWAEVTQIFTMHHTRLLSSFQETFLEESKGPYVLHVVRPLSVSFLQIFHVLNLLGDFHHVSNSKVMNLQQRKVQKACSSSSSAWTAGARTHW